MIKTSTIKIFKLEQLSLENMFIYFDKNVVIKKCQNIYYGFVCPSKRSSIFFHTVRMYLKGLYPVAIQVYVLRNDFSSVIAREVLRSVKKVSWEHELFKAGMLFVFSPMSNSEDAQSSPPVKGVILFNDNQLTYSLHIDLWSWALSSHVSSGLSRWSASIQAYR